MLAIGCDSAGFDLKNAIAEHLIQFNVPFKDFGITEGEKTDYPVIAHKLAIAVALGECERGILCCGTGIGMSIVANKIKGIRAACCSDYFSAKFTRAHNDANILCLGGRVIGAGLAKELVDVFLDTQFQGGRHATRVEMITKIEQNQ